MRRHASGVGCGACGRGRTYPRSREASGPDRGVLRPLREELAGLGTAPKVFGAVCEARQALSRCFKNPPQTGADTRKRGPGEQKSPRWSAERRPRSPKGNAARRKTGAPLGAPPPRSFEGKMKGPAPAGRTTAYPGPQRIRALMRACSPPLVGRGRGWGCWVGVVSDPTPTRFACRPSPQGGG
jgi:hypothetical protein